AWVRRTLPRSREASPLGLDRRLNKLRIRFPLCGFLGVRLLGVRPHAGGERLHVVVRRVLLGPREPARIPLDRGVATPRRDLVGDELEPAAALGDAVLFGAR